MSAFKRFFRWRTLMVVASVFSILALLGAYLSPFVHPETMSLLPFFGLIYWIILLVHMLLLVIWAFMRSRWSLILLGFILIGGKLHFRMFAMGSNEEPGNGTSLHVMSYNVRLFDLYNPQYGKNIETRNHIFDYIAERNPELICFQEFYQQDRPTSFITRDTLLEMLDFVDYHERYFHQATGRQNYGIVMMSRYPMIEKGFVNFPDQNNSQNYCIYADIVKESDTFRVYNVHLQSIRLQKDDYALFTDDGSSHASDVQSSNIFKLLNKIRKAYPVRAEQAKCIAEHARNSPHPVIMCGDFNDTPLSYTYNMFAAFLTDAFRNTSFGTGSTYAGRIPAGRIDYIFHDEAIGSHDFTIQEDQLSDHYAVDCRLFLKE